MVEYEVGVQGRNLNTTDPGSLETRSIYEGSSVVVMRILEGGPGGSLFDRLGPQPMLAQLFSVVNSDAALFAGCAVALASLGYRSLSLSPSAMGPVKAALLELDCRKAAQFLSALIDKPDGGQSLRASLEEFAAKEGLQL